MGEIVLKRKIDPSKKWILSYATNPDQCGSVVWIDFTDITRTESLVIHIMVSMIDMQRQLTFRSRFNRIIHPSRVHWNKRSSMNPSIIISSLFFMLPGSREKLNPVDPNDPSDIVNIIAVSLNNWFRSLTLNLTIISFCSLIIVSFWSSTYDPKCRWFNGMKV